MILIINILKSYFDTYEYFIFELLILYFYEFIQRNDIYELFFLYFLIY